MAHNISAALDVDPSTVFHCTVYHNNGKYALIKYVILLRVLEKEELRNNATTPAVQ